MIVTGNFKNTAYSWENFVPEKKQYEYIERVSLINQPYLRSNKL